MRLLTRFFIKTTKHNRRILFTLHYVDVLSIHIHHFYKLEYRKQLDEAVVLCDVPFQYIRAGPRTESNKSINKVDEMNYNIMMS